MTAAGEIPGTVDALNALPVGSVLITSMDDADKDFEMMKASWRRESDGWRYYYNGSVSNDSAGWVNKGDLDSLRALAQWRVAVLGDVVIQEEDEIGDLL